MVRGIQDGWIRWLDERESIELLYVTLRRGAKHIKYNSRIDKLRCRAIRRRQRESADFLVYQQAME